MVLALLGEDGHLDDIYAELAKNTALPCRELMWGIAGSMVAAAHLHRWTEEARWAELFRTQAAALLADALPGPGLLWDVDLYGRVQQSLGLVHGMAGNPFGGNMATMQPQQNQGMNGMGMGQGAVGNMGGLL